MGKHTAVATQTAHPWRATIRTLVAAIAGLAAIAAPAYTAITGADPAKATGLAAIALAISWAVTRLLALPQVDMWLSLYIPWLATGAQNIDAQAEETTRQILEEWESEEWQNS